MYQSWKKYRTGVLQSAGGFIATAGGGGAVNIGFNFRATSGFVTDNANEVYVLDTDTYPTTRGGFTFGWVQTGTRPVSSADRTTGVDVRLAGINYCQDWAATTETYFRVDLTPGTYNVRIAVGDASFSGNLNHIVVKDTGTTRFTVTGTYGSGNFFDSQSVEYSAAAWPGSNSPQSTNISTGQLRMVMGDGSASDNQMVAHLRIYS
jgi:hypothetical protein